MTANTHQNIFRYAVLLAVAWAIFIASMYLWNSNSRKGETRGILLQEARAHFNKDVAFRSWGAMHGGVYVPITDKTPPNPYLSHIPERDVVTTAGGKLTLMNPSYMMRQMLEQYKKIDEASEHLTSLRPLRPENAPDEWEKQALEAFENGAVEVVSYAEIGGKPYFRLMRPMVTKEQCLKCHAQQGYKVGSIRGGISIQIPMAPLLQTEKDQLRGLLLTYLAVLLTGIAGIAIGARRIMLKTRQLETSTASAIAAKAALQESERKFRELCEFLPMALFETDIDGNLTYANRKAFELTGHSPEDIGLTLNCISLLTPEFKERGLANFKSNLDGESSGSHEYAIIRKDGSVLPVEITTSRILEGDKAAGIRGVIADISVKKKSEEDIRRSEITLRRILESLPYCVMLVDRNKVVRYANDATLRLSDYKSLDRIVGHICHKTLCPAEENKCPILDLGQKLDRSERWLVTRSGDKVPIMKSAVPVDIGGEEMMLESFVDISKIKETENSLHNSIMEKDVLLKEVHHRVKNNMAVISALLKMQAVYVKDAEDLEMFNESQGRIKAMAIVHEQLYKTKNFAEINVADYLSSLAASVKSSHMGRHAVGIELDIDGISLSVDTLMPCGLIVNELLTNAFKHAFAGVERPAIRISLKTISDTHVRLSVSDNGSGLPDGFDISKPEGLGLQVVTTLCKQLQGGLEYRSDNGAVFSMTFPVNQ